MERSSQILGFEITISRIQKFHFESESYSLVFESEHLIGCSMKIPVYGFSIHLAPFDSLPIESLPQKYIYIYIYIN